MPMGHTERIFGTAVLSYATWLVTTTNIWQVGNYLFYWLLGSLNLGIHEAGHFMFLFPSFLVGYSSIMEFMHVAGGSLLQWLVPVFVVVYFGYKRNWFAASFMLFWVGQSLHDSVLYIKDAMVMTLPLLGGNESGAHDWNYLLYEMGVLYNAQVIGDGVHNLANSIIIISAALCWTVTIWLFWKEHQAKL